MTISLFTALISSEQQAFLAPVVMASADQAFQPILQSSALLSAKRPFPASLKLLSEFIAERNDPYMQQHPPQDVLDKPNGEKGKYTLPELYNQPHEMGVNWEREKRAAGKE